MSILIRNISGSHLVSPADFQSEIDLERLLSDFPDLLGDDGETDIKFVASQVTLPEAGKLDLLFVDGEGLPIAVETKLARNSEARREVVAQVIDYLSSLTLLTVDELDQRVNRKLEAALRELCPEGADPDFDTLWEAVGTNLRDGRARLVVVVDTAPPDLQRIFRFLARKSNLDVHLLSVQRYSSSNENEVFVPRTLVSPESIDRDRASGPVKEPHSELDAVFDAYNAIAPQNLRAVGVSNIYRLIRPKDWLPRKDIAYSFVWKKGRIVVQLRPNHRIGLIAAQAFWPILALPAKEQETVANGQKVLLWDETGTGRLFVEFPYATTPPETVAQAMQDLIAKTLPGLTQKLTAPPNAPA